MPDPLKTESLYGKHESVAPNPHIARAMFWVKYIETVGTGLNELLDACAAAGLKKPTIEANDIHFRLIIWRPVKSSIKEPLKEPLNEPLKVNGGNATTQSIFDAIVSNPGIKQKDLCDRVGISTASAKRHLALLDEFIEHRGSKKTGGYYAKEQRLPCSAGGGR